jgi:AcrR family transcriptional regulator
LPIHVDHDERRRELTKIAYNLIAGGGTEAATIRKMAEAAGYSTMIVSHYFANKKALLQATYDLSKESSFNRLETAGETGDLQVVLEGYCQVN